MKENNVKRGVFWSALERFSVQGTQFLMTIVISRFVLPEEYGLVAMISIFIALANSLIDCGFTTALIQKQDRTNIDFSTVFFFNIAVGIILYLLLFWVSPYIALFYNEPRLELLTKVVCFGLVISSANVVQNAKLVINMDFKTLSKASLFSAIVSGLIGVVMALLGFGVWAIVTQSILGALIITLVLWIYSKWVPKLCFSIESLNSLFGFGSKLMLSGLMHTIYLNIYTLVIGKFYNATDVGLFNRANHLSQFPSTNITNILNRVFFPLLCEQQNAMPIFTDTFHHYLRVACFIIFPLAIGLASLADPLIRVLLTDKWEGVILPLQILSIAYLFFPIMLINNQPLQALNHTDMFLRAEIVKKIVAISLLAVSIRFGLICLCLSILLYNVCDVIIILLFTRRIMATGFKRQIKELFPLFMVSVMMGVGIYVFVFISPFNHFLTLLLGCTIGGMSFCFLCKIFEIQEYEVVKKLIRSICIK